MNHFLYNAGDRKIERDFLDLYYKKISVVTEVVEGWNNLFTVMAILHYLGLIWVSYFTRVPNDVHQYTIMYAGNL